MTREEADTVLYLVDELQKRGATAVDVGGVKASFGPRLPAPAEREPKPQKSYHDRLFRHLPKGPEAPTRADRVKRKAT